MPTDLRHAFGRRGGALDSLARQEENPAPLLAIFGGVFALMLVFLLLINLLSGAEVRERLERTSEDGLYRIERMDGAAGYAVLTFPSALRIVESGTVVSLGAICGPGGAFVEYARRIYAEKQDQIVFFMLEGSVPVMAEARACLRDLWPERALTIGWVVTDNEFLKSVSLDDIPSYIRDYTAPLP